MNNEGDEIDVPVDEQTISSMSEEEFLLFSKRWKDMAGQEEKWTLKRCYEGVLILIRLIKSVRDETEPEKREKIDSGIEELGHIASELKQKINEGSE